MLDLSQQLSEPEIAAFSLDKSQFRAGPPETPYRAEFAETAYGYCMLGMNNSQLARRFEVSLETLESWIETQSPFALALHKGREGADTRVVRALFRRACGYSYKAEKPMMSRNGDVTIARFKVHIPPSDSAIAMWLQNRQGQFWKKSRDDGGDSSQAAQALDRLSNIFALAVTKGLGAMSNESSQGDSGLAVSAGKRAQKAIEARVLERETPKPE